MLAVLLVVLVPAASSGTGPDRYSAAITPTSVIRGTSDTYTVAITNDGQSTDPLASAQITVDPAFTVTGAAAVTPGTWTIGRSGNTVTLRASGGDELADGASVTVDITATAPSTTSTYTWTTTADSSAGFDYGSGPGNFTNSGADPAVAVTTAPDHLVLSAASTSPSAGAPDDLTITAEDSSNEVIPGYRGDKTLTFGGANVAPDNTHNPTVTDKDGNAVNFGQDTTVTFTDGVASVSGSNNGVMTLYDAETAHVTVSDGSIDNGVSGESVTVGPADAASFAASAPASATAGVGFDVSLTAQDAYGNTATGYAGSKTIDFSGPDPSPNDTQPSYPAAVTFTSGAGAGNVTLFDAETTAVTAKDDAMTSVAGTTGSIVVGPASPHHFDVPTPGTQTAGTHFDETLTAQDQFDNTADYSGNQSLTWGGAACSPSCPGTAPDGSHSPGYPSNPVAFAGGQATVSITLFKAESPKLGVTDGTISGSSNTFTVDPGPLGSFTLKSSTNGTIGTQTAGNSFTITATAFDLFLNQKTNYTGSQSAVLSGTLGKSSRGCTSGAPAPGGTSQCSPVYGNSGDLGTWSNGVATPSVTDFKAETGQTLTVKDGSGTGAPQGTSNSFNVVPNDPDPAPLAAPQSGSLGVTFTVQPGLSKIGTGNPLKGQPTGSPTVFVQDPYGNPVSTTVTMTIGRHASGASSTFDAGSTNPVSTNPSSGIAQFTNLIIDQASVNYTIVATVDSSLAQSGKVSTESSTFDVANDLTGCNGNSPTCQGNQSTSDSLTFSTVTITSTVTGVNLTGNLGTAVSTSITAPSSACPGANGQGFGAALGISGTAADFPIAANAAAKPTFTIVTRIDKSIVKKSGPRSPNAFDVCLGALNTLVGSGTACANPSNDPSFPTKSGSCAVLAQAPDGSNLYWGVLPDAPNGAKSCTDPRIKFPAVLSKTKNGAGDVILTTCVPYPFDPHPLGGP